MDIMKCSDMIHMVLVVGTAVSLPGLSTKVNVLERNMGKKAYIKRYEI